MEEISKPHPPCSKELLAVLAAGEEDHSFRLAPLVGCAPAADLRHGHLAHPHKGKQQQHPEEDLLKGLEEGGWV